MQTQQTNISESYNALNIAAKEKGLTVELYSNRYRMIDGYNRLLFIGSLEDCSDWLDAITDANLPITFLKPIELGFHDPIARPDYFRRSMIAGFIACIFFFLGIFVENILGIVGIPALVIQHYNFLKHSH